MGFSRLEPRSVSACTPAAVLQCTQWYVGRWYTRGGIGRHSREVYIPGMDQEAIVGRYTPCIHHPGSMRGGDTPCIHHPGSMRGVYPAYTTRVA